jgi:hypothetical protein
MNKMDTIAIVKMQKAQRCSKINRKQKCRIPLSSKTSRTKATVKA